MANIHVIDDSESKFAEVFQHRLVDRHRSYDIDRLVLGCFLHIDCGLSQDSSNATIFLAGATVYPETDAVIINEISSWACCGPIACQWPWQGPGMDQEH